MPKYKAIITTLQGDQITINLNARLADTWTGTTATRCGACTSLTTGARFTGE